MKVRAAQERDIERIEEIYAEARGFMRKSGNLTQWAGGYPQREIILDDIARGCLNVVTDDGSEEPLAVFYFRIGEDETYKNIYCGEWLKPGEPYGVIHRIAISDAARGLGVGAFCFNYCFSVIPNIRIDTHRYNAPMRHSLTKNGFSERGIIYLKSGDERIAYQKIP